jgi:hypothetical protein
MPIFKFSRLNFRGFFTDTKNIRVKLLVHSMKETTVQINDYKTVISVVVCETY